MSLLFNMLSRLVIMDFLGGSMVKSPSPETQEMRVWSLGLEDPLEEEMATHSRILAWAIPWTEKPGELQSMGSQRVGHDWVTEHTSSQWPWYTASSSRERILPCFWCLTHSWYSITGHWMETNWLTNYFLVAWNQPKLRNPEECGKKYWNYSCHGGIWGVKGDFWPWFLLLLWVFHVVNIGEEYALIWRRWMVG